MKVVRSEADGVFLRAFDVTIEEVYRHLAASGLDESEIWAAFRRTIALMAESSIAVETEVTSRFAMKPLTNQKRVTKAYLHDA